MLEAVDVQTKAGKLLDLWSQLFHNRFGEKPIVDISEMMEPFRWLATNFGYDKTVTLLPKYFQIQDDWIRNQGYSIQYFKNNLNKIIAMTGTSLSNEQYVVAMTECGAPVLNTNPSIMGTGFWFKPVLHNDWINKQKVKK